MTDKDPDPKPASGAAGSTAKSTTATAATAIPKGGTSADAAPRQGSSGSLLPAMSLPKGGGAIRGMGEKFTTNPSNGTGSLSVPIATSPGRGNFQLGLELGYDSGAGNGPFGIGWHLSTPCVTRKTDKGLPRYADGEDSDVFVLSGAEDLVPIPYLDELGNEIEIPERDGHIIRRYQPRTEGLFARIERWTQKTTGDVHWRVTTRDNLLNIYGASQASRIAEPGYLERVFSWLLEETRDDRGNVARYTYKPEDALGIDPGKACEANRFEVRPDGTRSLRCTAQRYLKRIQYGNRTPLRREEPTPTSDDAWLFEVVFDYGEHEVAAPTPAEVAPWSVRLDPFSSYRATFEVRTYRLCRRVLMFHRFAELGKGPCLVRSTDFGYDAGSVVTYLTSVTQVGYKRSDATGTYERATLPPLSLEYSRPLVCDELRSVNQESLEGIPAGVPGAGAQWVDLDGEGIPGVLIPTEQAWFYKSNRGAGELAPPVLLRSLPAPADLRAGAGQLTDLGADGNLDLVRYTPPLAGYFEHTPEGGWAPFRTLPNLPNIDWNDPNLRFLDLDGDGFPDVLITEHDAFVWYRSRAKDGFEPASRGRKPKDEREGAAVIFSDGTETVQLADMSGDGLVDIVRVRNGEVCYWPNLGYGCFGRKILLDQSPRFDSADQFDPKRVHLADIDGSGTSDIVYLGRGGVELYFNQSGNSFSDGQHLNSLPPVDSHSSFSVVDLLGQGTACLVWSSPLPGNAWHPLVYVDLMGGKKPHLIESVVNNLGAETRIQYASSTKYYLQDKKNGQPWLTRLAFPVQVIERIEHVDAISKSKLITTFAYHHGFYDGLEREFRGFARVEQWDAESFSGYKGTGLFPELAYDVNPNDPDINLPPVRTVTWFHTGAWLERERLERALAKEYYQGDPNAPLLSDTTLAPGLSLREEQEAARALRGQILRQEIYAEDATAQAAHPYSVSERDHEVRLLRHVQGKAHGVFFVHPRNTINLHYERNPNDPRMQQELVLEVDEFGNVTQAAAIGYPRRAARRTEQESASGQVLGEQGRFWATVTEHRVTNEPYHPDWYRVGVPIETTTSQLTGLKVPVQGVFTPEDLRGACTGATPLNYEETATETGFQKRIVERVRQLYYREYSDLAGYRDDAGGPLALGDITAQALPHQTLRLAFTAGLLEQTYEGRVTTSMLEQEGKYQQLDGAWWATSGRAIPDPKQFYFAVEAVDPFGAWTAIEYDAYWLLPTRAKASRVDGEAGSGQVEATDLRFGSVITVTNDYRVLAPKEICDPNLNRSAVEFDALGMVVKIWQMGQASANEGDTPDLPGGVFTYDLHAWANRKEPAYAHAASRHQHREGGNPFDASGNPLRLGWQHSRTYSDGFGRVVMEKVQAEPGTAPQRSADGALKHKPDGSLDFGFVPVRWVGTGRTVFDNKGNPVKKYEPFFSCTEEFENESELVEWGVTPILRYDPLGRLISTELPNGTESRVVFDAWWQETWDPNDAIEGTEWLKQRQAPGASAEESRAASLALKHAKTPTVTQLDSLGRAFLSIANTGTSLCETRTELDIEGNVLAIVDALGVRTIEQTFDVLGRRLVVQGPDAGKRLALPDVANKPLYAWDSREQTFRFSYDKLQRPTGQWVSQAGGAEALVLFSVYGEAHPSAVQYNLRGAAHQIFDGAGLVCSVRFDFKGNLLEATRALSQTYKQTPDWSPLAPLTDPTAIATAAAPLLEPETFSTTTTYDALGRVTSHTTPDQSVTRPSYNEANLLEAVYVRVKGGSESTVIENLDYNERGQRILCQYSNGLTTEYSYDPKTFRLTRLLTKSNSDAKALQDLHYFYDPAGNITDLLDRSDPSRIFARTPVSGNGRYEYDALYRLIYAEGREHPGQQPTDTEPPRGTSIPHPNDLQALQRYDERYEYDPVGNILRMVHHANSAGWTRAYQYAYQKPGETPCNRLLRTSAAGDPDGTLSAKYEYDEHGSMTSMPHLAQVDWDYADRMQRADKGGGGDVYFTYDGAGQRVRKVYEHSGIVEERIYLGGYEIFRKRYVGGAEPELERQTLHLMDDHRRVAMVETKTIDAKEGGTGTSRWRFQLDNHLGSAVLEIDDSGKVISYEEYHPYGTTAFHTADGAAEVSAKRYRYTGKERDEETGLYYHGARYYAPWLGRWTAADPLGMAQPGRPDLDLYAYVGGRAVVEVDPGGMGGERVHANVTEEPAPAATAPPVPSPGADPVAATSDFDLPPPPGAKVYPNGDIVTQRETTEDGKRATEVEVNISVTPTSSSQKASESPQHETRTAMSDVEKIKRFLRDQTPETFQLAEPRKKPLPQNPYVVSIDDYLHLAVPEVIPSYTYYDEIYYGSIASVFVLVGKDIHVGPLKAETYVYGGIDMRHGWYVGSLGEGGLQFPGICVGTAIERTGFLSEARLSKSQEIGALDIGTESFGIGRLGPLPPLRGRRKGIPAGDETSSYYVYFPCGALTCGVGLDLN